MMYTYAFALKQSLSKEDYLFKVFLGATYLISHNRLNLMYVQCNIRLVPPIVVSMYGGVSWRYTPNISKFL